MGPPEPLNARLSVVTVCLTIAVLDGRSRLAVIASGSQGSGVPRLPRFVPQAGEDLQAGARASVEAITQQERNGNRMIQLGAYFRGAQPRAQVHTVDVAYLMMVRPSTDLKAADLHLIEPVATLGERIDNPEAVVDGRRLAARLVLESDLAFDMCRERFTLASLQEAYEALLGIEIDPSNFRRKMESVKGLVRRVRMGEDDLRRYERDREVRRPGEEHRRGRLPQMYRRGGTTQISPPLRFG